MAIDFVNVPVAIIAIGELKKEKKQRGKRKLTKSYDEEARKDVVKPAYDDYPHIL
jgi:hypothetical protein